MHALDQLILLGDEKTKRKLVMRRNNENTHVEISFTFILQ